MATQNQEEADPDTDTANFENSTTTVQVGAGMVRTRSTAKPPPEMLRSPLRQGDPSLSSQAERTP
ncbi:hypothetical protein PC129_g15561 [Phytophthora cactorum]|nr:hypothetical protein Pcac1_g8070 [Phytophthora cactorum]KAG2816229.1 hypothetical protein PC112_g13537 [Phytophthora cactorum]KAG2820176.1 hypothetical protein PC111_g11575 [Phytophthora cactorum]KAG2850046.1 hypothetical protein PC113_g17135 [Phytophthora cactorum]KAG2908936.1 hypothetical protein PC115_g13444 [Phytophthora cactorum]